MEYTSCIITAGVFFTATISTYVFYEMFKSKKKDFVKILAPEKKEGEFDISSFLKKYTVYIILALVALIAIVLNLLPFAALVVGVGYAIKKGREGKVRKDIMKNFPNVLRTIRMALKAGLPMSGAVRNVVEYSPSPNIRDIFRKIYHTSTTLGEPIEKVMTEEGKRLRLPDLVFLASVIDAHMEVGGNIVEMLEVMEDGLRGLLLAREKVSSLMAEGKFSAIVLSILPLIVLVAMLKINTDYLSFFISPEGRIALIMALSFYFFGIFLSYKLTKVKI